MYRENAKKLHNNVTKLSWEYLGRFFIYMQGKKGLHKSKIKGIKISFFLKVIHIFHRFVHRVKEGKTPVNRRLAGDLGKIRHISTKFEIIQMVYRT